jgi:hypothetical protein
MHSPATHVSAAQKPTIKTLSPLIHTHYPHRHRSREPAKRHVCVCVCVCVCASFHPGLRSDLVRQAASDPSVSSTVQLRHSKSLAWHIAHVRRSTSETSAVAIYDVKPRRQSRQGKERCDVGLSRDERHVRRKCVGWLLV